MILVHKKNAECAKAQGMHQMIPKIQTNADFVFRLATERK